jgi:hypothetical protein
MIDSATYHLDSIEDLDQAETPTSLAHEVRRLAQALDTQEDLRLVSRNSMDQNQG